MIFEIREVAKFSKTIFIVQLKDPNSGNRQGHLNPVKMDLSFWFLKTKKGGWCLFSATTSNLQKHVMKPIKTLTLSEKCPYSELFWSSFSRIRTEYGEILRISSYSVWLPVGSKIQPLHFLS